MTSPNAQECCRIRKVRPLRKKLGTLKAWITGQRKDQSPGTRAEVPTVQVDTAFKGIGDSDLIKFNPLSNVSSAEVWALIRMTEVPYNPLHAKGFVSIGYGRCRLYKRKKSDVQGVRAHATGRGPGKGPGKGTEKGGKGTEKGGKGKVLMLAPRCLLDLLTLFSLLWRRFCPL